MNANQETMQKTSEKSDKKKAKKTDVLLDDADYIQELIYEFHTLSFGLPMGTTGSILGGLDGSTTRSREHLQSSLKDLVESSDKWFENFFDDTGM